MTFCSAIIVRDFDNRHLFSQMMLFRVRLDKHLRYGVAILRPTLYFYNIIIACSPTMCTRASIHTNAMPTNIFSRPCCSRK